MLALSKTTLIQSADASMAFIYGPERELLQSETTRNNGATHIKKVMLPGYEHSTTTESATVTKEEKYYLGSHLLITVQNGQDAMSQRKEELLFHDHIGSLVAVTDALGTVTERLSFDPWGRRRDWINWLAMTDQDWQTNFQGFTTQKGFTGHEMLDDLGLIHMGGRVYDPTLARFLSTDPVVQQPHNLQNYNRYSYVLNNPVSYTDPTGYFIAGGVEVIATALVGVAASSTAAVVGSATGYYGVREIGRLAAKNKYGPELLQIAVVAGCIAATSGAGTPGCIAIGSGISAASVAKANGASNHEALRFGLRTAAVAYVSSVMMQGIVNSGAHIYAQVYGFGVTSAWASAAMGGDPVAGFTSGIIAPFAGGPIMAGFVGGISSKLAGGKFEHGFMLGAISYLAVDAARKTQKGSDGGPLASNEVAAQDNDVAAQEGGLTNPTGGGVRNDSHGSGFFGAPRGSRRHLGLDLVTAVDQVVVSPVDGTAVNFTGATTGIPMVDITPSNPTLGIDKIRILYVNAPAGVQAWRSYSVSAGQGIGTAASLQTLGYSPGVTPHVHMQIMSGGSWVDPAPYILGR